MLLKRLHALLLHWFSSRYEKMTAERKQELLGGLRGVVVEIGPGTGPNLKFYSPEVCWIGIEPNPYMRPYLREEARRLGMEIDLRTEVAEGLPVPDASADAVVSTLVMCSVTDPERVIHEVHRVLKPGGRFLFLEHVADDPGTRTRRRQEWITPFWRRMADGCHPNRETWRLIENAGFAETRYDRFRLPLPIAGPHIAGVAVK
ncbi:MAG: class I SAM-dependent methyltransferase [Bryobacteraceae bacterium]